MGFKEVYDFIRHPLDTYYKLRYLSIIQEKTSNLKKNNKELKKRLYDIVDLNEELDFECEFFQDLNEPLTNRVRELEKICGQQRKAMFDKDKELQRVKSDYEKELWISKRAYENSSGFFVSKKKAKVNQEKLKEAYYYLITKGMNLDEINKLEEEIGSEGILSYRTHFENLTKKIK